VSGIEIIGAAFAGLLFIAVCALLLTLIIPPGFALSTVIATRVAARLDDLFPIVDLSERGVLERWIDYWVEWEERHKD